MKGLLKMQIMKRRITGTPSSMNRAKRIWIVMTKLIFISNLLVKMKKEQKNKINGFFDVARTRM